jgi:hypothetical protein
MPHSTSSSHRFRGRPLLLPPSISAVKIILGILLLFILSTCPSHLVLKDFKKLTIPSCPVHTKLRKIWWIKATIKLLVITILQLPAYKAYCLYWFRWGETRLWTAATALPVDMSFESDGWMILARENRRTREKNLSQCHFVHHKSRVERPGPQRWEAGD